MYDWHFVHDGQGLQMALAPLTTLPVAPNTAGGRSNDRAGIPVSRAFATISEVLHVAPGVLLKRFNPTVLRHHSDGQGDQDGTSWMHLPPLGQVGHTGRRGWAGRRA